MEQTNLLPYVIGALVFVGVLFLLRGILLWFWGITDIRNNQNETIRLLKKIAKEEDKND